MRALFFVLGIIFLLNLFSIVAKSETTCVTSDECPDNLVCLNDQTMRGLCVAPNDSDGAAAVSGKIGDKCSSAFHCEKGLICARPKGYLLAYGTCQKDLKHERAE